MNKKWMPLLLIVVLAVVLLIVKLNQPGSNTRAGTASTTERKQSTGGVDRNRGFDRRVSYLEFTEHAKCRMKCRKITQAEVEDIMREGKINYNKSDVQDKPCPTYAVEGLTRDDQRVRIVFAQCDFKTKVVTAIDLETEWECQCPGDDSKFKNKK